MYNGAEMLLCLALLSFLLCELLPAEQPDVFPGSLINISIDADTAPGFLSGSLYDMKRLKVGTACETSPEEVRHCLRAFEQSGSTSALRRFYRHPEVQYTSCPVKQPTQQDTEWRVYVYHGIVQAPESGCFRFVGIGDDRLIVRFNHQTILSSHAGQPAYSAEVEVEEGKLYPIQLLITAPPGKSGGYVLFTAQDESGGTLCLFRTGMQEPAAAVIRYWAQRMGRKVLPSADTPIWCVHCPSGESL